MVAGVVDLNMVITVHLLKMDMPVAVVVKAILKWAALRSQVKVTQAAQEEAVTILLGVEVLAILAVMAKPTGALAVLVC
jgi:hypothetical protein